jgi:hypothetical protein
MATENICTVGLAGTNPGVYLFDYDATASTLTLNTYLNNAGIDGSFVAHMVAIGPDLNYYVAGTHGANYRIYKLSPALVVDSTWGGGAGYAEIVGSDLSSPTSTNRPSIAVGLDNAIVCIGSDALSPIMYCTADGTSFTGWKGWDNNGNQDITTCFGGGFLPNGNIFCAGAGTSGDKMAMVTTVAGAYVNSYFETQTTSPRSCWIGSSGKVYRSYGTSGNTTLYASSHDNFSSVDYTNVATDPRGNGPKWLEHSTDGGLFIGETDSAGTATVHKLTASTGDIDSSYTYGSAGLMLSNGETIGGSVAWAGSGVTPNAGEDTTLLFCTDTSLSYIAGYDGSSQTPSYFYSIATQPAPIISSSSPTDLMYNRNLVAFSGDSAYYESDSSGTMTEITETGGGIGEAAADTFDMTESLTAADAYQKVFVANNTTLAVVDFVNTRISASTAFTNVSLVDHGTLLYQNSTDPATILVDTVLGTSVSSNTMVGTILAGTISTATDITTASGGGGDVVVVDGTNAISIFSSVPFIYNHVPKADPNLLTGAMPEAATLVARYRGRVVYSGNPNYPYQWYMARQADPFDFLYVVNDAQSPVAGADADAGEIGDIIQCLIPRGDDYLIFGCSNSVWLMRGDPASGGSLDELTQTTGIYGPRSWCFDDAGYLYFWGRGGIYRMPPDFSGVKNITATVLPNIVGDEAPNKSTHRIVMAYDRERLIVRVFITKMSDGSNSNYSYDIRTQGFFPESYSDSIGVFSAHYYEAIDPNYQKLYTGHFDSFIRYEDNAKKDDAGYIGDEAISSHAVIGPLQLGKDASQRGRMKTMSITTGTDTDGVTYDVHVADSAEEVVDDSLSGATPLHTGTISAGNRVQQLRPRSRGAWMGIKLENTTASETWQFEKLVADVKPAGDIK